VLKCGTYKLANEDGEELTNESGIAYASSSIRPFPLAALPISYLCE
jgi:hypothetical protein